MKRLQCSQSLAYASSEIELHAKINHLTARCGRMHHLSLFFIIFIAIPSVATPIEPNYAVFSAIPFDGHLNPLFSQATTLVSRGWKAAIVSSEEARRTVEMRLKSLPKELAASIEFIGIGYCLDNASARTFQAASTANTFLEGVKILAPWILRTWPCYYEGITRIANERGWDRTSLRVSIVDISSFGALDALNLRSASLIVNNPHLLSTIPSDMLPAIHALPLPFSGKRLREVTFLDRFLQPIVFAWIRVIGKWQQERGIEAYPWVDLVKRSAIITSNAFALEYNQPYPPNVFMVGALIPPYIDALSSEDLHWLEADSSRPVVYINMGTVVHPPLSVILAMAEAITRMHHKYRFLWKLDPKIRAQLPVNFRIASEDLYTAPWLSSPLRILSHRNVKLFVTHCGMNSVHESAYYGVPMIGIPYLYDQELMCLRLLDANVGSMIYKQHLSADAFESAISTIFHNYDRHIAALQLVQSAMRLAGGVNRSADIIEEIAAHGHQHLLPDLVVQSSAQLTIGVDILAAYFCLCILLTVVLSHFCICRRNIARKRKQD